jgi:hypothetical protein
MPGRWRIGAGPTGRGERAGADCERFSTSRSRRERVDSCSGIAVRRGYAPPDFAARRSVSQPVVRARARLVSAGVSPAGSNEEQAMETKPEVNLNKFVGRHLSQLKILSRLLEHELEAGKGAREITIERHLIENMLDTLEIFTDDCESVTGASRDRNKVEPQKPVVARLN